MPTPDALGDWRSTRSLGSTNDPRSAPRNSSRTQDVVCHRRGVERPRKQDMPVIAAEDLWKGLPESDANSEDTRSFVESLKSLRLHRDGRHYEGSGRLVFMSPSKSGPRHGLAPVWGDSHEPSCVVRGRLRFGASYSPRFHYDCPLRPGSSRRFPGCHRPRTLPPHRRHANVAPNDGIR